MERRGTNALNADFAESGFPKRASALVCKISHIKRSKSFRSMGRPHKRKSLRWWNGLAGSAFSENKLRASATRVKHLFHDDFDNVYAPSVSADGHPGADRKNANTKRFLLFGRGSYSESSNRPMKLHGRRVIREKLRGFPGSRSSRLRLD